MVPRASSGTDFAQVSDMLCSSKCSICKQGGRSFGRHCVRQKQIGSIPPKPFGIWHLLWVIRERVFAEHFEQLRMQSILKCALATRTTHLLNEGGLQCNRSDTLHCTKGFLERSHLIYVLINSEHNQNNVNVCQKCVCQLHWCSMPTPHQECFVLHTNVETICSMNEPPF